MYERGLSQIIQSIYCILFVFGQQLPQIVAKSEGKTVKLLKCFKSIIFITSTAVEGKEKPIFFMLVRMFQATNYLVKKTRKYT